MCIECQQQIGSCPTDLELDFKMILQAVQTVENDETVVFDLTELRTPPESLQRLVKKLKNFGYFVGLDETTIVIAK